MFKLMFIFMSLFLFVGCEDNGVVIDESLPITIHFAIEDSLGIDDWQDFITITVNSDNVITDIEFNGVAPSVSHSRRQVSQLDSYKAVFGYNFYEQASSFERSLIGTSGDELVKTIRNAYRDDVVEFDTTTFADLAHLALASAPVERGPYLDGTYRAVLNADENGWQYFVNLFIINGDIVAVHFNGINDEGALKYDPLITTTTDSEVIQWRYQAQHLEQALIQFQDPLAFTFDEDGFTTEIPGVDIEIESFVKLVTQALATGPVILEIEE